MFVLVVPLITGETPESEVPRVRPLCPTQVSVCWWFDQRRL
jgi:hypothetical protein